MNDWELLQGWARERSDAAFGELVRRYLNLVYNSALRRVGEPELARDISQAVFLALAQKAHQLNPKVILSGWLFRTTGFVAARAVRSEVRRKRWEMEASSMNPTSTTNPAENWSAIQGHLDGALQSLSARDRDALLVRFFEQQPLRVVAERFGISEHAAKKRVSRATEKLRSILGRGGVALSATAVADLLLNIPTQAAPADLPELIAHSAINGAVTQSVATLSASAARDWFLAKCRQCIPISIGGLLLLTSGVMWWRGQSKGRSDSLLAENGGALAAGSTVPVQANSARDAVPKPGISKIYLAVKSADGEPLRAAIRAGGVRMRSANPPAQELTTDENGLVEIAVDGRDIDSVHVAVAAPGYVPVSLTWKKHEFVAESLFYTAKLQRGLTLEGVVQTEDGTPVPNAFVSFNNPGSDLGQRQNISFNNRLTALRTDEQGRFRSTQLPVPVGDQAMSYSVEHDQYVRVTVPLNNLEALRTNHIVTLKPGVKVRGLVVNANHQPIPGAKLTEAHQFGEPRRSAQSDASGAFEIGPFVPGEVLLAAAAEGYEENTRRIDVSAATTNLVLQLSIDTGEKSGWERGMDAGATVRVSGKVMDEKSGEPIPVFRVRLNEHRGSSLSYLGEGHTGQFDWPVFMAFFSEFSLEVDADGYQAAKTEVRPVRSGAQNFEVKLHQSYDLAGIVVSPDGEPVSSAFVGLNGDSFGCLLLEGCKPFAAYSSLQTVTDANGRFSFKPKAGAESVLVVHELGCVQVSVNDLQKRPIILQPWGSIEGTLIVQGEPRPDQAITLTATYDDDPASIDLQCNTTTDSEGRFRFPKVAAGNVLVARLFNFNRDKIGAIGCSHHKRVVVPPGGVAEVRIGGDGVTVTGKLALSQPLAEHNWRDDLQCITQKEAAPPKSPAWNHENMHATHKQFSRYSATVRKYFLEIAPDGLFRVEDVAPGEYTLELQIAEPFDTARAAADPADPNPLRRRPLVKSSFPITVPESSSTVDVGLFTIPLEIDTVARIKDQSRIH